MTKDTNISDVQKPDVYLSIIRSGCFAEKSKIVQLPAGVYAYPSNFCVDINDAAFTVENKQE
jgi:hypothetical protein